MRRRWMGGAVSLVAAVAVTVAAEVSAEKPASAPAAGGDQAAAPAAGVEKAAATAPAPSRVQRLRVKKVILGVRHRAIQSFYEEDAAKVGEEFPIGDTEYTARILRFEPDFVIEAGSRRFTSKSERPDNPAFQIVTSEKGAPHDTSWAFLNFPPHFSKRSLIAYQVLRIEFENHAPIVPKPMAPPDTSKAGGRKP